MNKGWIAVYLGILVMIIGTAFSPGDPDAAEETDGEQVYMTYCVTCHGEEGQGLTAETRARFPEGEQNCWASKCHALNHPPDGFTIPRYVPAVIGDQTLSRFNTAEQLYFYIRATMPSWAPNLLEDTEYRALARYLVAENYARRGQDELDLQDLDLSEILVHEGEPPGLAAQEPTSELQAEAASQLPTASPADSDEQVRPTPSSADARNARPDSASPLGLVILAGIVILAVAGWLWRQAR